MSAGRAVYAVARADFLERVRRYSFLITLLFAVFLGYSAATGRITLQLGGYRGIYTSAWIGALVALTTTCFVSLVGFYIVKNGVDRDRQTGVGQILAATPLSKPTYALGKFASNFAVLVSMVAILAIAAVCMQLFAGEDRQFNSIALLAPFVLVAMPPMALTAALAIVFEMLPFLRGGIGNIAWFFVWSFLGVALPVIVHNHRVDPLGLMAVSDAMMAGARAYIPSYKDGFSFTIADKPVKIVQSFHWDGVAWTSEMILLRIAWIAVALVLVMLASIAFDRFDVSRSLFPSLRKLKQRALSGEAANSSQSASQNTSSQLQASIVHLTPLAANAGHAAFDRIFSAELRLALQGIRWWGYAVAAGFLIAQFVAPLDAARGPILGSAWFWCVFVWSAMGSRESRFGMQQILFSCPKILPRQFFACWLSGVFVALLTGSGAIARLVFAHQTADVFAVICAALFIPALSFALGVLTGSGKFFEALFTLLWYVGPMNHTRGLDYTGAASGLLTVRYASIYLALAVILLLSAFAVRARQLRGN
jgi:hypothetical protein